MDLSQINPILLVASLMVAAISWAGTYCAMSYGSLVWFEWTAPRGGGLVPLVVRRHARTTVSVVQMMPSASR